MRKWVDHIFVQHDIEGLSTQKEGTGNFMLACNGHYFYVNPASKYRGLHFVEQQKPHWTLFKTIDSIDIGNVQKVIYKADEVEVESDRGKVTFQFTDNSLVIHAHDTMDMSFTLDMRNIHDFDDKGRIYELKKEKESIVVDYKKYKSSLLEEMHYNRSLTFTTDLAYTPLKKWREKSYKEDEKRKSNPDTLYVFDALKLSGQGRIEITFVEKKPKITNSLHSIEADKETQIAYMLAQRAADDLYIKQNDAEGYYAGLPWFFQIWTRDEGIALKYLIDLERFDQAKHILLTRIKDVQDNGRIPNRVPHADLETADGTGWVFRRLLDLVQAGYTFKKSDKDYVIKQLEKSIQGHIKYHLKEDLIYNGDLETWMDTSYQGDTRAGARIEIQALWLAMLALAKELIGDKYEKYLNAGQSKVRKTFFAGNSLKDGATDDTVRPNVFLACYVYQDLLKDSAWERVFDNALKHLWLDWGGLSTIQKDSQLYQPKYTGEDNRSYHRGDSWFFVNNIAAICMHRINAEKYNDHIAAIAKSSKRDLLYNGIVARPSELSSAVTQTAQASLFQLWSATTYIELIQTIKKYK